MAHLYPWTARLGLQPQGQARVTLMLMPGTLQTAEFTGSQDSWGWKALLPILNVPITRDFLKSLQGIQNPQGQDLEQPAVADSALSSYEEAHLNPKACTTKHAFYISRTCSLLS